MTDTNLTRGEQTAQEILRAAYDLFVKQGYHGTSMRQISQNAGIALGGIYNHFSSKEDIFKNVFLKYHPIHDFFPDMIADANVSLEQLVRNAIGNVKKSLDRNPEFLNLVLIEVVEFNTVHIVELFSQYYPIGEKMVLRLKTENENTRTLPTIIIARSIMGMIFTYYISERILGAIPQAMVEEDSIRYFADILLYGLASGGKPSGTVNHQEASGS